MSYTPLPISGSTVTDSVPLQVHVCVPIGVIASKSVIVEPVSEHATSNVGVVSFVRLSVSESPKSLPDCRSGATGVSGEVVSIVIGSEGLGDDSFPA